MGHDHQQSSSSGTVVAIVVAVLLVAILGIVAVAGAGLFLVGTSSRQLRAVAIAEANVFSVRINADPECPVKLLIPVLDACEEVGDIDFRVAWPKVACESLFPVTTCWV